MHQDLTIILNKAEYDHDVKNYADRSSSASVDNILQAS